MRAAYPALFIGERLEITKLIGVLKNTDFSMKSSDPSSTIFVFKGNIQLEKYESGSSRLALSIFRDGVKIASINECMQNQGSLYELYIRLLERQAQYLQDDIDKFVEEKNKSDMPWEGEAVIVADVPIVIENGKHNGHKRKFVRMDMNGRFVAYHPDGFHISSWPYCARIATNGSLISIKGGDNECTRGVEKSLKD